MTWLLLAVAPITVLFLASSTRRHGLTPAGIFVVMHTLAAISIIPNLDDRIQADVTHGYLITISLATFCIVSFLAEGAVRRKPPDSKVAVTLTLPGFGMTIVIILALLITLAYFRAVGYSALFAGIENSLASGQEDVAGLRLESYAGERYLFPGYVNQFKNAILPGLSLVAIYSLFRAGRRPYLLTLLLTTVSVFSLLGTGQRGNFILFVLAVVVFLKYVDSAAFPKRAAIVALTTIPILLLSTFALGRSSQKIRVSESKTETAIVLLSELSNRFFRQGGEGQIAGFRYISLRETVRGREWLEAMQGLLPGSRGSSLANEIFAYQYGSDRGNSSPSLWGSAYHNFGFLGTLVVASVLACIMAWVTLLANRSEGHRSVLQLFGIAGVSVALGTWTAGSPIYVLNAGIVPFALMWWIGRGRPSSERPSVKTSSSALSLPMPRTVPSRRGAQHLLHRRADHEG